MARVLFGNLAVEVQWEPLLGLSKESEEVRELASRRGAKQCLVLQNALGVRVAGLANLPVKGRKSELFALAGLLREVSDDPNILFLHQDPEDPSRLVLVAIHDGKPMQDRVIAREAALDAARQFIQEVGTGVTILGDIDDDMLQVTRHVNLEDIVTSLTDEEKAAYRLQPLPGTRLLGVALLFVALGVAAGGGWWWMQQQEKDRLAALDAAASQQPDPMTTYRNQMQSALKQAPLNHGAAYARTVLAVVQQLPFEVGGWRVGNISCKEKGCTINWKRQDGGNFQTLLEQRKTVQFLDMGSATEVVPLPEAQAALQSAPVDVSKFYMTAGVRMQALDDMGKTGKNEDKLMAVVLGKVDPLVPLPQELKGRVGKLPALAKGSWSMQGHLAFLDSVPGLMERAGNMTLDAVEVTLNDKKPEFTAKGTFYVQ
ncbi:type 4b pilus protein PilO2 [Chromobacterium subtsugae]|uniref:type 4b pilus protein PilO2 n=1 Tax=Chromobacterium subtsugae TaxID=251747 RepID=UPI0006416771|nr:type 4b pilus protein PilO2 [Chromobacterium subtsugae]